MTEEDKPVTKKDLFDLRTGILAEIRADLRAEIQASSEKLSEQMWDIETALLRAFGIYAQGVAAQIQKLNGSEAATEIRLSTLESRVLEQETRRRN